VQLQVPVSSDIDNAQDRFQSRSWQLVAGEVPTNGRRVSYLHISWRIAGVRLLVNLSLVIQRERRYMARCAANLVKQFFAADNPSVNIGIAVDHASRHRKGN
jgi:hypothetical protein